MIINAMEHLGIIIYVVQTRVFEEHELFLFYYVHPHGTYTCTCTCTCTSRLDIPGEDVARQFVLDLGVFLVSLATLVIDIFVVVKLRPPKPTATGAGSGNGQGGANGTTTGGDGKEETEIEAHHVDSESGM